MYAVQALLTLLQPAKQQQMPQIGMGHLQKQLDQLRHQAALTQVLPHSASANLLLLAPCRKHLIPLQSSTCDQASGTGLVRHHKPTWSMLAWMLTAIPAVGSSMTHVIPHCPQHL